MGQKRRTRTSARYTPPRVRQEGARALPGVFVDGLPFVVVRVTCDDPGCAGKCL